jgi:hypothetical protein
MQVSGTPPRDSMKLLSIAKHRDKARSAGILPAREKCRQDGGATINGCHYILQSSVGIRVRGGG